MSKAQIGALVALAILVLAGTVVEHHPYFGLDGVFAFNAWFGFLAAAVAIAVAHVVGKVVKRKDDGHDH